MIKYRTRYDKIEAVEVLRETEKMVVIAPNVDTHSGKKQRMTAKRSDCESWHDTFDDAKSFLTEEAQKEVDALHIILDISKCRLRQIKGIVKADNMATRPTGAKLKRSEDL